MKENRLIALVLLTPDRMRIIFLDVRFGATCGAYFCLAVDGFEVCEVDFVLLG